MDYLTLLASRSLTFFPSPKADFHTSTTATATATAAAAAAVPDSPPASPTTPTPTSTSHAPAPAPIRIPLANLTGGAGADTDLAYFLMRHILRTQRRPPRPRNVFDFLCVAPDADAHPHPHAHGAGPSRESSPEGPGPGNAEVHLLGVDASHSYPVDGDVEAEKDAEVRAWVEIYKAKTFLRDLGAVLGRGQGVGERECRGMALRVGLDWEALEEEEEEREGCVQGKGDGIVLGVGVEVVQV